MKTFLVRLGFGFMLASIVGALSGCVSQPIDTRTAPSYAKFEIKFDPPAQPTTMVIDPDGGNVVLEVVKTPGPDDNKVIWWSKQKFSIKFGQIIDKSLPLPPGKELGDEAQGWNVAKPKGEIFEYRLNLKQGSGPNKEYVEAKYSVKHVDSGTDFDPVIIVGR